jgi:hypothetical protein
MTAAIMTPVRRLDSVLANQEMIDLKRATSKRIATVPLRIERHTGRHRFHPHWLEYRS